MNLLLNECNNADSRDLVVRKAITQAYMGTQVLQTCPKTIVMSYELTLPGAGDLFAAGFLHAYLNNLSTKECLEKGTEMSSRVIQQIGARL